MIADFKFDSSKGNITINGSEPIISITDIKIERKKGEPYSTVTLKFDANVVVEGRLALPAARIFEKDKKKWKEGELESPSK